MSRKLGCRNGSVWSFSAFSMCRSLNSNTQMNMKLNEQNTRLKERDSAVEDLEHKVQEIAFSKSSDNLAGDSEIVSLSAEKERLQKLLQVGFCLRNCSERFAILDLFVVSEYFAFRKGP